MHPFRALLALAFAACLGAHPMGNFSVSHYSRLLFHPDRLEILYVLDLAEIPTFELMKEWGIQPGDKGAVARKSREQAAEWVSRLAVSIDGRRAAPSLKSATATISDGAGGMPVLRVSMEAEVAAAGGELGYEDGNYPNRTGWKEIVIQRSAEVRLVSASAGDRDLSHGLTVYPADLAVAPPQMLRVSARWEPPAGAAKPGAEKWCADGAGPRCAGGVAATPAPEPGNARGVPATRVAAATQATTNADNAVLVARSAGVEAASFAQQQPAGALGVMRRGDFLSRLLSGKRFGWGAVMLGLLAAFSLGCLHALSPGHGKTIVAAYLAGSRCTLRHALFLGFAVTFTHTISVFLLGIGVLFFQRYIVPDRIIPILGAVSGLSIVAIGLRLLYQRSRALLAAEGVATFAAAAKECEAEEAAETAAEGELVGAAVSARRQDHHSPHYHAHERDDPPHSHDHGHSDHRHEHHHAHPHVHGGLAAGHVHPPRNGDHHRHRDGGAFVHTHTHDGHTHAHVVPAAASRITLASLVALGVSGGIVPCPSALVLLLSAIAIGQTALGLFLLTGFSAGLALVLMAIGAMVLYARHLLPGATANRQHPAFRLVPVFSAVVVIILGLLMTLSALGLVQPVRFPGS